ncbi:MAG: mycothiol synthase [Acidimicrobiales bacterium]|jgi:mycothiol synthase
MEGPELSVVSVPDQHLAQEVNDLLERVARSTGHAAVGEPKRTALTHAVDGSPPGTGHARFVTAVVARAGGRVLGYAPVIGDAHTQQYATEVVVDPAAADAPAMTDALVDAAVGLVTGLGGGSLRLWVARATPGDDQRAVARGFDVERDLIQMRCVLPVPDGRRRPGPGVRTRPFRPGLDEEGWLAANNRAFAAHPEQGHWDMATLVEREKEAWFDPEGLLILEEGGQVAGSCWTKIHTDTDPAMGEIYVIGVDPQFHGRGWGRALTQAGLDWLAHRGLTVGMLYVDADNVAAVSMYRSMGFVDDHVDRAYVRRLD